MSIAAVVVVVSVAVVFSTEVLSGSGRTSLSLSLSFSPPTAYPTFLLRLTFLIIFFFSVTVLPNTTPAPTGGASEEEVREDRRSAGDSTAAAEGVGDVEVGDMKEKEEEGAEGVGEGGLEESELLTMEGGTPMKEKPLVGGGGGDFVSSLGASSLASVATRARARSEAMSGSC